MLWSMWISRILRISVDRGGSVCPRVSALPQKQQQQHTTTKHIITHTHQSHRAANPSHFTGILWAQPKLLSFKAHLSCSLPSENSAGHATTGCWAYADVCLHNDLPICEMLRSFSLEGYYLLLRYVPPVHLNSKSSHERVINMFDASARAKHTTPWADKHFIHHHLSTDELNRLYERWIRHIRGLCFFRCVFCVCCAMR